MECEARKVLVNWVRQALSQPGQLGAEIDSAIWIADQFGEWLNHECGEQIRQCESWLADIQIAAGAHGGWNEIESSNLLEAAIHAREQLDNLRCILGVTPSKS